jgi:hypothetical protein
MWERGGEKLHKGYLCEISNIELCQKISVNKRLEFIAADNSPLVKTVHPIFLFFFCGLFYDAPGSELYNVEW